MHLHFDPHNFQPKVTVSLTELKKIDFGTRQFGIFDYYLTGQFSITSATKDVGLWIILTASMFSINFKN